MKHFLILITYLGTTEQIAAAVSEHRAFLQGGYDRGWLLISGPTVPKTGGIVVGRAPSLDELQAFFQDDPYRLKNLASYLFIEFDPVKFQPEMKAWIYGAPSADSPDQIVSSTTSPG